MSELQSASIRATARLFGRLLLHEIDGATRAELLEPEVASALADIGLDTRQLLADADLDELAGEFLEAFVKPKEGGPLVQSLWTEGSYEGDCTVVIRKLAEAAGVEFDRAAARGAPHDHLGSILLLWSAVQPSAPEVARRIEAEHLRWAMAPLARLGSGEGFYAAFARALGAFLPLLDSAATGR